MTREEAYNRIDAIIAKHEIDDEYVTVTNEKDYDALRLCRKVIEQEPCEDAISRQAVLDAMYELCDTGETLNENLWRDNPHIDAIADAINNLPPVTPQPKTGHWIWEIDETPSTYMSPYELNYAGWVCSCCHEFPDDVCEWDDPDEPPTYKFCPNCGAKMVEGSEGE